MYAQEHSEVIAYYCRIITSDNFLLIEDLFRKIPKAPSNVKKYLRKQCQTPKELEEFFTENSHYFFVENGRIALFKEELETAGDDAEAFFKEILEKYYKDPVHYMTLKMRHIKDSPDNVITLITRFYPSEVFQRGGRKKAKDFGYFLRSRPDVFVVDEDDKVFLVDAASVDFFKKRLKIFGRDNFHFLHFRGHVAQAPTYVKEYINRNYFGDDFQIFLRKHSDVFRLSNDGCVSLVS